MRIATNTLAFLFIMTFFSNCSNASRAKLIKPDLLRSSTGAHQMQGQTGDSIRLQYTGCGGFLIRHGNEGVLIDPYFSNANVLLKVWESLKSDTALIDTFFVQNFNATHDTEGIIKTVLISHAHHDHLADLPSILKRNLSLENLTLIGSKTMANLIQSFALPLDEKRQIINFDSVFAEKNNLVPDIPQTGEYASQNGRVRITAVKSGHAPHLFGIKFPPISGEVETIPESTPKTSIDYKEGVDYNYMIDFLNKAGSVVFRIFSSAGAAANAPIGFPPPTLLAEKKVDVLLLCAASFSQVQNYPNKLVEFIKPEKIFLAHWEDFFTPIPELLKQPRTVPMTDIPKFMKILKQAMTDNGMDPLPIIVQPLTPVVIKF